MDVKKVNEPTMGCSSSTYCQVLVAFVCKPFYKYSDGDSDWKEEQAGATSTSSFILDAKYARKVMGLVPTLSDDLYPNFNVEIFSSETHECRVKCIELPTSFFICHFLHLVGYPYPPVVTDYQ